MVHNISNQNQGSSQNYVYAGGPVGNQAQYGVARNVDYPGGESHRLQYSGDRNQHIAYSGQRGFDAGSGSLNYSGEAVR